MCSCQEKLENQCHVKFKDGKIKVEAEWQYREGKRMKRIVINLPYAYCPFCGIKLEGDN